MKFRLIVVVFGLGCDIWGMNPIQKAALACHVAVQSGPVNADRGLLSRPMRSKGAERCFKFFAMGVARSGQNRVDSVTYVQMAQFHYIDRSCLQLYRRCF